MDIRIEKTKTAIHNTFLELRSKKPLEKITIKELCEKAQINKSTFYSHYEDIYALSQMLESETITTVIKNISSQQESPFKDPDVFTRNLYMALVSNHSLINILFSGTEKSHLGDCLETELKRRRPAFPIRVFPAEEQGIPLVRKAEGCGDFYSDSNL